MDGFDNEVLKNLQETAVRAAGAPGKVAIVTLDREPDDVYGVVTPDGKLQRFVAEPDPRDHELVSLTEAILYANDKGNPEKTVIWFDRDGVAILLDDETRRDRARLSLNVTPQLALLQAIEKDKRTFEQQEFRRLLRIDLAGCRPDDALLNWVSDMRFSVAGESGGRISHQKDSMGIDLEHEAMSEYGLCPEEIELQIRIFDDPALLSRRPVRCSVEVLSKEKRFRLLPLPLALHDAIEQELDDVGESIRKSVKCKVFRGCP